AFDLDGEAARIRRQSRVEIGADWERQRLRLTLAINPEELAGVADRLARNVDQIASRRDVEVGDAAVAAHQHAFEHREWLPDEREPIDGEADREEIAIARVDKMTRWRI